ncbi:MAG: hypothetical protein K1X53_05420 [Candidatus Sumerlaeaceae bacterium]|nr:hypothetical protein [Candidatus Sumerlaeaceae bacterium]
MSLFRGFWCIAIAGTLVLAPTPACANVPLPTIFVFSPTVIGGWMVFLASFFGVIAIETAVLAFALKNPFGKALKVVSLANLLTTVIGVGIMFHPFELLVAFIIASDAGIRIGKHLKWGLARELALSVGLLVVFFAFLLPMPSIPMFVVQVYVLLFAAFCLTTFYESVIYNKLTGNWGKSLRWSLMVNGASYACLFLVFFGTGFRSGTFAIQEWFGHEWQKKSWKTSNRTEAIAKLEELYTWRQSASKTPLGVLNIGSPWPELMVAQAWIKDGHTSDARDLLVLVDKYNDFDSPEYSYVRLQWNDVIHSLKNAMDAETSRSMVVDQSKSGEKPK